MTMPMQWALRRRMMMAALGSGIDVAALSITYTGAHTDYGMVTMSDGARYRLLAFTSSGTLSIEQPVNCEVCVVGGGANGGSTDGYGSNGGTGAGGYVAGTGDGISKYPFEDTGYSLWAGKPHCGGGGGGGKYYQKGSNRYDSTKGGDGGTNGGNGGIDTRNDSHPGGSGGAYGGGSGGKGGTHISEQGAGKSAAYYGSGGGGAGLDNVTGGHNSFTGGSGYQGIVYMRIPEEPPAYISDLPLGALINVGTDGGAGTPNYEIADKDNLVSGGVVLVRKNIYSNSAFGSNTNYPDSTLDNLIKTTIYNEMPQQLRDKMMDVTFNLSGSGNITRKMFALTYTMVGFGNNNEVAEGKALQLYTSNNSRIKALNGSAFSWRLSSSRRNYTWTVSTDGSAFGLVGPSPEIGVVPAFVIPSETRYDPTSNTDGSYNLIL